jgi:hypothetical protein
MNNVAFPLYRLRKTVGRFVAPSDLLCDVSALKAQIELRQFALEDIEVIRRRLRPFLRCKGRRRQRGSNGGGSRSRLANTFRASGSGRRGGQYFVELPSVVY